MDEGFAAWGGTHRPVSPSASISVSLADYVGAAADARGQRHDIGMRTTPSRWSARRGRRSNRRRLDQAISRFGDRPVRALSQRLLDFPELRFHAIPATKPRNVKVSGLASPRFL